MFIQKKKINHSSFDLYHSSKMETWVDKFDQDLVIGKVYNHLDYGQCRIERIAMTPRIKLSSFLLFWFEVEPDYDLIFIISHQDQGMSCVSSVPAKEFIKHLVSFNLFASELDKKVLSKK